MKAASSEREKGNYTDDSPDPGGSRIGGEKPEGKHDDDIRGKQSGCGRPPTDNLGKRHRKEHGQEDTGEIRIG